MKGEGGAFRDVLVDATGQGETWRHGTRAIGGMHRPYRPEAEQQPKSPPEPHESPNHLSYNMDPTILHRSYIHSDIQRKSN